MGRSVIVYFVGLTLIVGIALNNVARNSTRAMDAYSAYYEVTQVHNIAVAGANVGTSYLLNYAVFPTNFGVTFFSGHDTVTYLANTPQPLWVTIRSAAWTSNIDDNGLIYRDTVEVVFKHVQFAKYSWFTENEINGYLAPDGSHGPYYGVDDWKVTGDSVYGPAHTNGRFNLDGTPYFDQKVTSGSAPNLGPSAAPVFRGGSEFPVHQARPNTTALETNLTSATTTGGFFNQTTTSTDVGLTFMNSQVRLQIPPGGSVRDTTMPLSALAPNGVIVVKGADLHIRGTYDGNLTVAAFGGTGPGTNKGNVWIDGDVTAMTSPVGNLTSPDMLGIVAGRMAYITEDLTRSTSSVLNIQAAIYCQNGELSAQNFWSIPASGRINLFGGVTQTTAGSMGLSNGGPPLILINGYSYSIRNDPRFETRQPPHFPYSDSYQLLSWWEN